MRLLTNNWILTTPFVSLYNFLLTVGRPCNALSSHCSKVARDGHTHIASAQKRKTSKILYRVFVQNKCLRWAGELSRLFLKKTSLEMILFGIVIAVKASTSSCGRPSSGAAGNHELTSTQGEDQTQISSSGGGQEKSTAWDVSRPHRSDMLELNSPPFFFVIVDSVGITVSNSLRVYMDLQCPNTSAEEQVESFYTRVRSTAVLACSILVKNDKAL